MATLNPTPSEAPEAAPLRIDNVRVLAENTALPHEVQSELSEIHHIIGLAAFAIEARRILQGVDVVADSMPHVGEVLSKLIETRCQWAECPDMAADVLIDVHERLGALLVRA